MAVDDHPCLLEGLAIVLREAGDIELVASAPSAEAALNCVKAHRPDVAILDTRLPGMSGVEAIEPLAEASPGTTAVMYLAEGLRTDEVAERVGLSPEPVKADTKRAVHRLEAIGRVHAVAYALRRSYIT